MSGVGSGRASIPTSARVYTESAPFACRWQCAECGYQAADEPVELPGYRTQAVRNLQDQAPDQPCPHCGEMTWANLREGGVVETLKERDKERRLTRNAGRSGAIKLTFLALWLGAVLVFALFTDGIILLPLALGTALLMIQSAYREYLSGKRRAHAAAWTHAPLPRGRVRRRLEGLVVSATLLQAPLSGRPCVAYELGVRHDEAVDAPDSTWTLLEQEGVALEVDGQAVDPPYYRLERTRYADALSPSSVVALRKRGIDVSRPGYVIYETVVELGDSVVVEQRRSGIVLRA